MMTEADFLSVIDAYASASGLADATVSTRLFNDGKKISQLRYGGTITLSRANDALKYLSVNWPKGTSWPKSVKRPPIIPPNH